MFIASAPEVLFPAPLLWVLFKPQNVAFTESTLTLFSQAKKLNYELKSFAVSTNFFSKWLKIFGCGPLPESWLPELVFLSRQSWMKAPRSERKKVFEKPRIRFHWCEMSNLWRWITFFCILIQSNCFWGSTTQ